jgi:sugar phosphate isomerase/epimerase
MKYAICNETFQDWPFERAFAFASQCGYTGLEIAPFTIDRNIRNISAARRQEVRRQAQAAGLEIIGLHWLLAKTQGLHLTSPDAHVRRATASYLEDLGRLCRDLGGSIMVFGSPKQRDVPPGVTQQQALQFAAEVFRCALPTLAKLDVVLALEPLGPVDGNFLNTAAQARELMRRVDHPNCRLHLDVKAMASESIPIPELIRSHADVLAHFHANDANLQGPGFGTIDFVPILAALRSVGYSGWVSVEVFDYSPGVERLARESINYLRQCAAAR